MRPLVSGSMETGRRRVLMLAYFFPPLGGAGVQRTLKFVKYLAPLGWDATVVSTRSSLYPARDPSLLDEVPDTTGVIRTPALPVAHWVSLVLYRLRLRRLFAWVTWPDGGVGWFPFALWTGLRVARSERPEVIFSSSPPQSGHLAALIVHRLTGIPWVADFRDEWAADAHRADQPRRLAGLAARAERAFAKHAQRSVVAADYFDISGLPNDDPRRVEIPNGVDHDDLVTDIRPPLDRFVLAYVGTIYGIRDPSPVFRALARLVDRGDIDGQRFEVRLVGSLWLEGFEPPAGIEVQTTGYVDHARALREMSAATALLLYVPSASLAPSGKLFEYLASGRPILSLTHPDNLASRLVDEWRAGVVADPHDEADIERGILTLWNRWQEHGLPDQESVRRSTLERYSRRAGAERLAAALEEASNS
jgi:glycosyltransferase involved in cell wall biosynthesis